MTQPRGNETELRCQVEAPSRPGHRSRPTTRPHGHDRPRQRSARKSRAVARSAGARPLLRLASRRHAASSAMAHRLVTRTTPRRSRRLSDLRSVGGIVADQDAGGSWPTTSAIGRRRRRRRASDRLRRRAARARRAAPRSLSDHQRAPGVCSISHGPIVRRRTEARGVRIGRLWTHGTTAAGPVDRPQTRDSPRWGGTGGCRGPLLRGGGADGPDRPATRGDCRWSSLLLLYRATSRVHPPQTGTFILKEARSSPHRQDKRPDY